MGKCDNIWENTVKGVSKGNIDKTSLPKRSIQVHPKVTLVQTNKHFNFAKIIDGHHLC